MEYVPVGQRVFMRSTRALAEGEELLADYGDQYVWVGPRLAGAGPQPAPPRMDLRDLIPGLGAPLEELALGLDPDVGEIGEEEPAPVDSDNDGGGEDSDHDDDEEPDAEEAPEGKEPSPLQEAKLGDFALFQLDPNAPLVLGRVDILDELREYAWVQEYYTYTPGKRQARFAPAYRDPRDDKLIFTSKPLPRYSAEQARVEAEHFRSELFALGRRGVLPEDKAELLGWVR